jgi:hypothetical protein
MSTNISEKLFVSIYKVELSQGWLASCMWSISIANKQKKKKKRKKLRGLSPQANYTDRASDRRLSAKIVPTFADRGCCVVSATGPHGHIFGLKSKPMLGS